MYHTTVSILVENAISLGYNKQKRDKEGSLMEMNKKQQELMEYVKELGLQIEKKKLESPEAYELDEENYKKFADVYAYFNRFAKENDGKVKYMDLRSNSIHADVSIEVPLVDLYRDGLAEFTEILAKADVFGVTPTANGELRIDASVNNVWKEIQAT